MTIVRDETKLDFFVLRLLASKKLESLGTNSKQVFPLPKCSFDGKELGKKRERQNCYDVHGT